MIGLRGKDGKTIVQIDDRGDIQFEDEKQQEAYKDAEKAQQDNKKER